MSGRTRRERRDAVGFSSDGSSSDDTRTCVRASGLSCARCLFSASRADGSNQPGSRGRREQIHLTPIPAIKKRLREPATRICDNEVFSRSARRVKNEPVGSDFTPCCGSFFVLSARAPNATSTNIKNNDYKRDSSCPRSHEAPARDADVGDVSALLLEQAQIIDGEVPDDPAASAARPSRLMVRGLQAA